MSHTLLPERRWNEFFRRLEGPEGCDFTSDPEDPENTAKISWRCKGGMDKTYAAKILADMGVPDARAIDVLKYVEGYGGHCDCEILFNAVERVYADIDAEVVRQG